MAELTAAQLRYVQSDLSLGENYEPFSESELNDYYTRASSDYAEMLYLLTRALRFNASKFTDYTVGQTSEKLSQIRQGLDEMLAIYEKDAQSAQGQFRVIGVRDVPTTVREFPHDTKPAREARRRKNYYGLP